MENKSSEVKEEIINRSIVLFMRYGIKSVTMDDIARELGISKKTIYQHFSDKDDIINIATKRHIDMECEKMLEIGKTANNAVEHLHLISLRMRETFKNMNSAVLYDLKKYHKNAWNIFLDFKTNLIFNEVVNTLNSGIEEGYFRKEIDAGILATLRVAEIQMSFDQDYFSHEEYSLMEIQSHLLDHFIHGILTPKGLELFNTYKNQLIHEE